MRRVLFFDTETTGLDFAKDQAIEVAGVLWDVEYRSFVSCFSTLVQASANPAEKVNHIPAGLLKTAAAPESVWSRVHAYFEACDAVVAHNAAFDYAFTPQAVRAVRPWICSLDDLMWPRLHGSKALTSIALAYGVAITDAHRALSDCLLLAKIFERAADFGEDIHAMLLRGLRPKVKVAAIVAFKDNDKARDAGFRWDGEKKYWWRSMAIDDLPSLQFEVRTI